MLIEISQSHGHASEQLTLAAASAAGRYGHVLFPSGSHLPALKLAEKLKKTVGHGWADRVFYSDNGSTGMEVALKMGLRASGVRYGWEGEMGGDVGILGLRGSYHGDTVGTRVSRYFGRGGSESEADWNGCRLELWMPRKLHLSIKQSTGKHVV